jgi:hypothetical protein
MEIGSFQESVSKEGYEGKLFGIVGKRLYQIMKMVQTVF